MEVIRKYEQIHGEGRIRVTFADAVRILWLHFRSRIEGQVRCVLPVVVYLFIFQIAILRNAISHAASIAVSVGGVVLGLMFFMEGLRLWLMPVGETIGDSLPRKSSLTTIIGFAFLVGVGATFAEPAIGALKAAGSTIEAGKAPLLHALLNRYATPLAVLVGLGVGMAVIFGTLRFLGNWSLKSLLVPLIAIVIALTAWAHTVPELSTIIGLAWDFGAVIVGPITVPLVLGLGLGVCRASGRSDAGMSGFGAVTLISIFPILTVFALGFALHYLGFGLESAAAVTKAPDGWLDRILATLPVQVVLASAQAILPLCVFLFVVQIFVLRERMARGDEVGLGLAFALLGLILFNLGLLEGLTPLGDQVGNAAPGAFSQILMGEPPRPFGPLYGGFWGTGVILIFAFFLGYGATLAEPALGALGTQVHEITVGAIRKAVLMHTVSLGVGLGMAAGVARVVFGWPLAHLLIPAYLILLVLTLLSTEEFASIGWDSGAVTTGPFTVPLVVALGLGLGRSIPGVVEGFGILSLATAGPIIAVLLVGLVARPQARAAGEGSLAG